MLSRLQHLNKNLMDTIKRIYNDICDIHHKFSRISTNISAVFPYIFFFCFTVFFFSFRFVSLKSWNCKSGWLFFCSTLICLAFVFTKHFISPYVSHEHEYEHEIANARHRANIFECVVAPFKCHLAFFAKKKVILKNQPAILCDKMWMIVWLNGLCSSITKHSDWCTNRVCVGRFFFFLFGALA